MMVSEVRCPICGGQNSSLLGGSGNCFHCDTCGFVECCYEKNGAEEWGDAIKKKLVEFYDSRKALPEINFNAFWTEDERKNLEDLMRTNQREVRNE